MSSDQPKLDAALKYLDLGWSVIPLRQDKKPRIKWAEYQRRLPTVGEVSEWWGRWPGANIGIVTGAISGLIVIDIDSSDGHEALIASIGEIPGTIAQKTGKPGGRHLFFRHPGNGTKYQNMARTITDVDVRADGGYVMVAPSVHPNGTQYQWDIDPAEMGLTDLLDIPGDLKSMLKADKKAKKKKQNNEGWVNDLLLGVKKGARNDSAAKLAGYYIKLGMEIGAVESAMMSWNNNNEPPLDYKELRSVIASIAEREGRDEMGQALGMEIDNIQMLKYPDGKVLYNVQICGIEGYAQVDGKTLGTFNKFRWQFMDMCQFIPERIKQNDWEKQVNKALEEVEIIRVHADETEIGVVSGAISSVLKNNSEASEIENIDRQICVIEYGNEQERLVCVKIHTIGNLVRFEGEKIPRRRIGEILRKLGFRNKRIYVGSYGQKTAYVRCWVCNLDNFVHAVK